jgi:hypothetical protein
MISGPFAMSFRAVLAASAVFAFASPAFAQDAPAPAPAPAPAAPATTSPEEAAMEAKGNAFGQRMEQMATEMQAAMTAAAGDTAKATTDLNAIAARYQPDADAFAADLEMFIAAQSATATPEQQAQAAQMGPAMVAQIKSIPNVIKDQALASAAAPAAPVVPQ